MMSMLVPRSNRFLNDLMTDPFDNFFGTMAAPSVKTTPNLMRTDIRETETGFELTIDLPGFDKEGVQAELKDGYLTVTAETKQETEDKEGHLRAPGALKRQVQPYLLRRRRHRGRRHQGQVR